MEWSGRMREWRHNPCLMRPVTAILLLLVALVGLVVTVLKFPTLVLGWCLAPVLSRAYWIVEFWYPTNLGKWCHVTLVRWVQRTAKRASADGTDDASRGFHSRALETRIEVVPGRVFVHILPQWLDNLGYLVVCLPPAHPDVAQRTRAAQVTTSQATTSHTNNRTLQTETTPLGEALTVDPHANATPCIVAFCVDCGDANQVIQHVRLIRETFYDNQPIHVQSILSTHKHHDHTAGNLDMLKHPDYKCDATRVKLIFGGAADNVPGCNYPLANGDKLPLPHAGYNDMNDVVEVEAVATPAHTRGSLTYVLRPLSSTTASDVAVCLFTGDTIFCGGGGVPFEADLDADQDSTTAKLTAHSYINASAAAHAMERCLAEVLFRSVAPVAATDGADVDSAASLGFHRTTSSDGILVFPGHEYTHELLARQLATPSTSSNESCKWKNMAPNVFFQTVSQYYVSLHRRTLPSNTGKLLTIPSTVTRERVVNPHLRSLKQRGTVVIAALKLWHRNFCRERVLHVGDGPAFASTKSTLAATQRPKTTRANTSHWNLSAADVNRPIFTTLYAADLETLIHDMSTGRVDAASAATKLKALSSALDTPATGRRPIPGTLPTSRNVYRGLLGLALLGSSPTALTHSDSKSMNLPAPVGRSSDVIRVSKRRLVAVLHWLGLLDGFDGQMIVAIIGQLWKETKEYVTKLHDDGATLLLKKRRGVTKQADPDSDEVDKNDSTDVESIPETDDDAELGALKWIIYGIPTLQPKPWLSSFCMPCFQPSSDDSPSKLHPAGKCGMQRNGGELVRHDVFTCPLCRDATGRAELTQHVEQVNGFTHQMSSSMCMFVDTDAPERDEQSSFIEVSPQKASPLA